MKQKIQSNPEFFRLFEELSKKVDPIFEKFQRKHNLCEKDMRALIDEFTICNIAIPDEELKIN